jgi:fimbrial chaperone protein
MSSSSRWSRDSSPAARRAAALVLAFLALLLPAPASATLRVAPLFLDLDSLGEGAQASVRLDNDRARPVAVEVRALAREIAPDGTEAHAPADAAFAVFPVQTLIPPGEGQVFRIRYVGDPAIERTRSYHLAFQELPLALGGAGADTSLDLLLDLRVGVHVSPPEAVARLAVASHETAGGRLAFTVQNRGARYAVLADRMIELRGANGARIALLSGEELLRENPSTLVPAGGRRRFVLSGVPRLAEIRSLAILDAGAR